MTKPNCCAVGTVIRIAPVTPKLPLKPFINVDIEMAPADNGYKQRLSIRSQGEPPSECRVGSIISVSGEGSTVAYEARGKWYSKLVIYGRISVIFEGDGVAQESRREESVAQTPQSARPIPKPMEDESGDQIPF